MHKFRIWGPENFGVAIWVSGFGMDEWQVKQGVVLAFAAAIVAAVSSLAGFIPLWVTVRGQMDSCILEFNPYKRSPLQLMLAAFFLRDWCLSEIDSWTKSIPLIFSQS